MDLHQYVNGFVQLVESYMTANLPGSGERPGVLNEAAIWAISSGGKRLRPVFCLASAEAAGGEPSDALAAACAIECLHAYTLVHDDLPCMDNDEMRRGKPSVWKKYGETLAVLAGDVLQARAFGLLSNAPRQVRGALLEELAYAADGVVRGQVEDLKKDGALDKDRLLFVFRHKTGDLFRCACRMGAICAGAGDAALQAITEFSEHLGVAFQIEDDLLDAKQGQGASDADETSCLALMTEAEARAWCEEETAAALKALSSGALPSVSPCMKELALKLVSRTM